MMTSTNDCMFNASFPLSAEVGHKKRVRDLFEVYQNFVENDIDFFEQNDCFASKQQASFEKELTSETSDLMMPENKVSLCTKDYGFSSTVGTFELLNHSKLEADQNFKNRCPSLLYTNTFSYDPLKRDIIRQNIDDLLPFNTEIDWPLPDLSQITLPSDVQIYSISFVFYKTSAIIFALYFITNLKTHLNTEL